MVVGRGASLTPGWLIRCPAMTLPHAGLSTSTQVHAARGRLRERHPGLTIGSRRRLVTRSGTPSPAWVAVDRGQHGDGDHYRPLVVRGPGTTMAVSSYRWST